MEQSGSKGEQQFDTLLRPHLDRLYRLAYRLTGAVSDAEDLVQDLLVKLYQRRGELTSITDLAPWLSRVLYNQFVDSRRRSRRERLSLVANDATRNGTPDLITSAPDPGPGPEKSATHEFDIRRLQAAIECLSDEHKMVILLHDSEGYTLVEVHRITGVAVGTLKSRLHRARARLRQLLADGTISDCIA